MIRGEPLKQFSIKRYYHVLQHDFLKDFFIRAAFSASLVCNIVVWILFLISERPDGTAPFVLHYSVFRGIDLLGPITKFYLLLGGGTIILSVNFFLARVLYRPLRIASYILGGATVATQLIIIITFITFRLVNY